MQTNLVIPPPPHPKKEYKFVILHLSDGQRWFWVGTSNRFHTDHVWAFCCEHNFTPLLWGHNREIKTAKNQEGVTLEVKGGGLVHIYTSLVIVLGGSVDYGNPDEQDVKAGVEAALSVAGLERDFSFNKLGGD